MKKIKVIEYGIDDAGLLGVFCISMVEQPAIGVDFVALSEQHSVKFKEDFRGLLYGALLIPDQLIYRRDDKTEEEYYVKYSKDTIRAIAYNYLKQNMTNNATVEHAKVVEGVSLVETWIIEGEHDKSKNFGFDLPEGTWFGCMKVENEEVKKQIQNKEVLGFSIEGNFAVEKEMYLSAQEKFAEGQPHYTADGKLYEGPTHKNNDRLMTGAEHTEESEYLYHADELENLDLIVDIEQAIQEEIDARYDDYMNAVNMTYSELKAWSETECSQLASLDRGPINRNLELLQTNKAEWGEKEYNDAGKTIAFINRMRENDAGDILEDSNGNVCGSKRTISLLNWAYDPNK